MRAEKSQRASDNADTRLARLAELFRQTPSGKLDEKVVRMLTELPSEDVRKALVEVIKRTSEDEFLAVKSVYLKHFGNSFH